MYFILVFCVHINCCTCIFFLQCWIYEHFPTIYNKGDSGPVSTGRPHSSQGTIKHTFLGGIVEYQRRLDALTIGNVISTHYVDHKHTYIFDVCRCLVATFYV